MKETIDILGAATLGLGLIVLWLCWMHPPRPKAKRNHKSSDILGGKEL